MSAHEKAQCGYYAVIEVAMRSTIPLYMLIFILSAFLFIGEGFMSPGTYYNWGDTVFPLNPERYLEGYFYTWNTSVAFGAPNVYQPQLPIAFILYLINLIKIPLWIINRLWLILPYFILGCGVLYLYRSVFEGEQYRAGALVAAVFPIFMPYTFGNSLIGLAVAGVPFFLGSIIRGLKNSGRQLRYAFFAGLGMALIINPRILYIALLATAMYIGYFFLFEERFNLRILRFLGLVCLSCLLLNLYWIVPFIVRYLNSANFVAQIFEYIPNEYHSRLQLLYDYKGWTGLAWVSRLITGCPTSSLFPYFHIPLVAFVTFAIPLYAYTSVLLVKSRRIIAALLTCLTLTLCGTALHYPLVAWLYEWLFRHLPGFIVLNNPLYWLPFVGIFYAVLCGATTAMLVHGPLRRQPRLFVTALLCFHVFVFGQPVSIGWSPEKNIWGNITYPFRLPSMRIPQAYWQLRDFLVSRKDSGARVLTLPWNHGGYVAYSWWHYYTTPDIITFISPLPIFGTGYEPDVHFRDVLIKLGEGDFSEALSICADYNIKYIIVHKDYQPIPTVVSPPPHSDYYIAHFKTIPGLLKLSDNPFYALYEIKTDEKSLFYAVSYEGNDRLAAVQQPTPPQLRTIKALYLDGSSYVTIPHSESLGLQDSFTLSAWIFPETLGAFQGVVMKWAASADGNDNYGLAISKDGAVVTPLNIAGADFIPSWMQVYPGQWNFIASVYDNPSGTMAGYLDGKALGVVNVSGKPSVSDVPLLIGANNGYSPMSFFKGYMSNVQIYAESLKSHELMTLYRRGIEAQPLSGKSVAGYWPLGTPLYDYVEDMSGKQNHGFLKGSSQWAHVQAPAIAEDTDERPSVSQPLSFRKNSPVSYVVSHVAARPFYMVFNERFDYFWECRINGKRVSAHTRTENGLNRWYIDDIGDLSIDIHYRMQDYFNVSLMVAAAVFLAGGAFVLLRRAR